MLLQWSWCLFTSVETQIKTEVGTKDLGVAVIDLTVVLLGRIWTLGLLGLRMKAILVGG